MLLKLIKKMSVLAMILALAPACAEQGNEAGTSSDVKPAVETAAPASAVEAEPAAVAASDGLSIMDKPVNFSTPEDVEKSIEAVREQAGEAEARNLRNALGYILAYDLSIGRDKEKMYQKLNGRTPNEIIAKMKR